MTIPLNDRDISNKVLNLKRGVDTYWKISRQARQTGTNAALVTFFKQAKQTQTTLNKLLANDSLNSLQTAFQSTYGWTSGEWASFRDSAGSVHTTLVPAVLTLLKANESTIMDVSVDSATGDTVYNQPISGQLQIDVIAALQAVENEYTL